MAAIWGKISFNGNIQPSINSIMSQVYNEKCRLDRISMTGSSKYYMGCGIINVTRESRNEIVPIIDEENGVCITCDCILDNRNKLKKELNIKPEESVPDGTLIYRAYCRWGIDCVTHFRGTYSIAVYDFVKQTLYLIADPVSSRCLYYYKDNKGDIIFSTLIEPIRAVSDEINLNKNYIKDYLTAPGMMPNVLSKETPYEGIYKLNPGTYLRIQNNSIEEVRYFSLHNTTTNFEYDSPDLVGKNFRKLFTKCVKDAMNTSGNVSIAMSSGLDSSSVGALAADILAKDDKNLWTYTYVPCEEIKSRKGNITDETKDVEKIVNMHPNMIPEFVCNDGRNCLWDIDNVLDIMEMPVKAYVNIPNLCEIYDKAYKNGSKIVLVGQNGNSTISHGYIDDVLADLYLNNKMPTFLKYLNNYSKTVKESRKKALKGCRRYFKYTKHVLEDAQKDNLSYALTNQFVSEDVLEDYPLKKRYKEGGIRYIDNIPTIRSEYRDFLCKDSLYTYLGELETKLGLRYGVILRDPTKDIRLLRFCYHLPYKYFAYQGTPRWLVRGNFRDILPTEILDDWMRYGVQNADCYNRLNKDWPDVMVKVRKMLEEAQTNVNLKMEEATEFFRKNESGILKESESDFDNLTFVAIANTFVRWVKSNKKV